MYKVNEKFIEKIINEDYTIIHIGQATKRLKWIK
jgi:hypothetical protein